MKLTLEILTIFITLSGYIFYIILLSRLYVFAADYIKYKKQRAQDTNPHLAKNITIISLVILLFFSLANQAIDRINFREELREAKIQKNKCEEHLNDVLFLVRYTNNKLNRKELKNDSPY